MADHNGIEAGSRNLTTRVSTASSEPEWDAFLARTPGGHHVQTSLWGTLKSTEGWQAVRVVVSDGDRIVAGAQMLHRRISFFLGVGYVQSGPVINGDLPDLAHLLFEGLRKAARQLGIGQIYVQPPYTAHWLAESMTELGFRPSRLNLATGATTMVSVDREPEDLLSSMRTTTRQSIRKAIKSPITVRDGNYNDIPSFYSLLKGTAARQDFVLESENYFEQMWRLFRPPGHVKLLIAEYQGEPISAAWLVPFGDTVIYKRGAWSGRHGNWRPNELLQWSTILWARDNGYRYYDLDGVHLPTVAAFTKHGSVPAGGHTVTVFKIGFGGDVVRLPPTHEISYGVLSRAASDVLHRVRYWRLTKYLLKRRR